jgi:hypothetical protein
MTGKAQSLNLRRRIVESPLMVRFKDGADDLSSRLQKTVNENAYVIRFKNSAKEILGDPSAIPVILAPAVVFSATFGGIFAGMPSIAAASILDKAAVFAYFGLIFGLPFAGVARLIDKQFEIISDAITKRGDKREPEKLSHALRYYLAYAALSAPSGVAGGLSGEAVVRTVITHPALNAAVNATLTTAQHYAPVAAISLMASLVAKNYLNHRRKFNNG